ncbi:hypothetical protein ABG768_013525 [Culter alburnus]|uniref:PiggyBac transposable element-derived protein domain-containing protein n=1 Tax=Culter alburnus TaxID=194366 RepID=A0AAW2B4L2_CULAL
MHTLQALVPENPQDSDVDLSDVDDPIEDQIITPSEKRWLVTVLLKKKKRKTHSLKEPEDTPGSSSPSGPHNGTRRIWKHEDIHEEFQTSAKSRRWYIPLFGYILDLFIANYWLVYKRDCGLLNEKAMPLKRFRLAVAHSLNQVNKPASKVGRPSSSSPSPKKHYTPRPSLPKPQPDVRHDSLGHWPQHCDKQEWCNYCPKGVSRLKCQKCNVFLCLNANQECFAAYHQK